MASAVADQPDAAPSSARRARVPRAGLVAGILVVVVVLDQATKQWALSTLHDQVIEVVGSLRFFLTWNTGTAFSIGSDLNVGPFVAALALVVVGWLLQAGYTARPLGAVAAGLVAGGALGNLIDRALRSGPAGAEAGFMGGAVVDFIDLGWWPVFNVADACIVGGALLLVAVSFREPEEETEPDGGEEPAPSSAS